MPSWKAKALESMSIRHRSDANASVRCLFDVDPKAFTIWDNYTHMIYDIQGRRHGDLPMTAAPSNLSSSIILDAAIAIFLVVLSWRTASERGRPSAVLYRSLDPKAPLTVTSSTPCGATALYTHESNAHLMQYPLRSLLYADIHPMVLYC